MIEWIFLVLAAGVTIGLIKMEEDVRNLLARVDRLESDKENKSR
jgi:outer membrane murein-binding lipoprotein Lpp